MLPSLNRICWPSPGSQAGHTPSSPPWSSQFLVTFGYFSGDRISAPISNSVSCRQDLLTVEEHEEKQTASVPSVPLCLPLAVSTLPT